MVILKGSIMNEFKVGDGATELLYSDAHAYTVIAVSKNGRIITMQRDKATLLNGADSGEPDALKFTPGGFAAHCEGTPRYSYERDPEGGIIKASLRINNKWRRQNCTSSGRVIAGRHEHYDYNF